ncbi:MAG TPA: DUF4244 domain-containing protein [Modestobacter sp.]|jgi:hypothetical protein|nr:DUF4244 domain-containing protein [Modestobacter sp.]
MTTIEDEPRAARDQLRAGTPARRSLRRALADRWAGAPGSGEAGMSTAEYAVGTVAACAFAAVLYKVVTGGSVVTALGELVQSALSTLS